MRRVIEMTVVVAFVLAERDFLEKGSRLAEEGLLESIRLVPGVSGATITGRGEDVATIPDGPHDHLTGTETCARCGHTKTTAPLECCEMCAQIRARRDVAAAMNADA